MEMLYRGAVVKCQNVNFLQFQEDCQLPIYFFHSPDNDNLGNKVKLNINVKFAIICKIFQDEQEK